MLIFNIFFMSCTFLILLICCYGRIHMHSISHANELIQKDCTNLACIKRLA